MKISLFQIGKTKFFADADSYLFLLADADSALFQFLLGNNYKIWYFSFSHILYIFMLVFQLLDAYLLSK